MFTTKSLGTVTATRTFRASLEELYEMLDFVMECAAAAKIDPVGISKIELATEEACVNVISYAYPGKEGAIAISCSLVREPGSNTAIELHIAIIDQGIPYNPLEAVKTEAAQPQTSECTIGGYGIHLITKLMDQVEYAYEDNKNRLTMIMKRQ